mgnify:CR=1 FL=1
MIAPETIMRVAELMAKAERAAVLTGAGVSAESGVPTFRGKHGFWKDEDVMKLATLQGFLADPKKVWEWYDWRRGQLAEVEPNPGHHALAQWERMVTGRGASYSLITQNIDGLHELAGSKTILELHGNLWYARCLKGCSAELKHIPDTPLPEYPPPCPWCDSILRPHVVWFGEQLDPTVIEESFNVSGAADLMLVVGGRISANTARLAEICRRVQPRTHHIETAAELETIDFTGVKTVGLTSGASTPTWIIEQVRQRLSLFR